MPNKKSAEKRVRQNERRRDRNRSKRSNLRTYVKKAREAADAGQAEGLDKLVVVAQSALDKAAKTNLIKKNAARRKVSRLMKAANKAGKKA